ncbi:N-acetylmuramoyl-L-alanine amidase [Bacillus sp. B15-48]|uniref:N-acetylmuramoyl-L-alanine amidase n=1 Tax=Bacillus sp. B15-48 TaxID=1548601 RepID=UPI00193EF9EC|nr:N-acetylmuramoyl-L-alanine amidase [Bacillus sp. B15-48]MBM4760832.1 N-acetylmuramoyl-L-alanine amidase [Bacillus sp. B15-48]
MRIMLDAGHGYNTPGKRSPDGMREYEFNRAIANFARDLLQNYQNVTVYFAHSDQTDVPLRARTDKANQLNVNVYVSIHANAHGNGGWTSAGGIETYVFLTRPPVAYQLAQKIQQNLVRASNLRDRGVKTGDLHVLRETKMDAVLVECGFMTNRDEIKLLRSEAYRRTCAEAIVNALAEQFKLVSKTTPTSEPAPAPVPVSEPEPAPPDGLYKVQVGAFRNKQSADQLTATLKSEGYETFVYSDQNLFKIQVGAFSEKSNADALAARLQNDGYETYVYRD